VSPTVHVDGPFGIAISRRTRSVYVADSTGVAVFDGAACNGRRHTGCARTPIAVPAGNGSIGVVLDDATNTVYVADAADSAVVVIDADTCNAHTTTSCQATHPAVPVGSLPSHLALDPASHTLYVSNEGADAPGHTLSMIDTTRCNGRVHTACSSTPPTATVGGGPAGLVLDRRSHTLYVSNSADNTVTVLDTATCNSGQATGCRADLPVVHLAGSPVGGALDEATGGVLVPTWDPRGGETAGTLSMISTLTCNATVLAGCSRAPLQTPTGSGPIDVAVNQATHRAYVVNEQGSDVSVVDLARCNATHPTGCQGTWPTMAIGFDGGATAVDAVTDTIYASAQQESTVTVLDGATCNSRRTIGCRHPAPTTGLGIGPAGSVLDHHTRTLYVPNQNDGTVSVLDPTACNAQNHAGCGRTWPTTTVGDQPKAAVVDEALDTLYTANETSSTVSVVDTRTCNAADSTGCAHAAQTITVAGGALALTLDPATHTLYVANVDSDTVSVIDASSCNSRTTTGCGQHPRTVRTGNAPAAVQLDPSSGTLYVSNNADNTVALVDTRTCNAHTGAGCGSIRAIVPIVDAPRFMTLDPAHATLYVSTKLDSSLAMIDTGRCNAHVTTGCPNRPPVVHVGFLPYGIAADPGTGRILVGNVGDSTVTSFAAATCNARVTTGCDRPMPTLDAGAWPTSLVVDDRTGTLYVSDSDDATASIINLRDLT
jgi:YVTN family beta-propeller protein